MLMNVRCATLLGAFCTSPKQRRHPGEWDSTVFIRRVTFHLVFRLCLHTIYVTLFINPTPKCQIDCLTRPSGKVLHEVPRKQPTLQPAATIVCKLVAASRFCQSETSSVAPASFSSKDHVILQLATNWMGAFKDGSAWVQTWNLRSLFPRAVKKKNDANLTLGAQGRPLGKLTLSAGGLRGGGGGGGWMMTSRSKGSTSPSIPLSVSSGSSSSSRASSFLKGSRSLYVSRLSCLTSGWVGVGRGQAVNSTGTYSISKSLVAFKDTLMCN